jgi:beta-lysine 5,6-aminomutase alpha subunit
MYGILFRDINPERTFVDQFFSRVVSTYAGITINTGEDNYLTTADAVEKSYTAVASQFINEAFAFRAGMPSRLMGLGHAFEKDPDLEDSFLLELGDAQLIRQLFPDAPLKFMPPTRYMTGNIFRTHVVDALFNLAAVITGQTIQLLGILTEAIHTPHLQDRMLSLENARYVMNTARHLGQELQFKPGGIIEKRANETLTKAVRLLEAVERRSLWEAIADGVFADVSRPRTGGKGHDGIIRRAENYYNPLLVKLLAANQAELKEEGESREQHRPDVR